ncbi:MAG: anion permease, partial [Candidatus Eisenbacteria bacterium]|nr:anion permease [Candidatus Eisenbacteria bacterium]
VGEKSGGSRYGKGLLIALGWGAVVGGTGTLLGGARAPLALGILRRLSGEEISFIEWTRVVFPVTVAMIPVSIAILFIFFSGDRPDVSQACRKLSERLAGLGPISRREKGIAMIFLLTVLCWIFLSGMVDLSTTAILASVALFVFRLVNWADTEEYVNWGIILMYGGAIALGTALSETGAAEWIASSILPWGAPTLVLVAVLVVLAAILTEGMSSAAVVAFLLPLAIGFATPLGLPARHLAYLIAVAAGLVYIFPMGAPPIAIIFSSKQLKVSDLLLPGVILHLVSWTVILLWVRYFWPLVGLN